MDKFTESYGCGSFHGFSRRGIPSPFSCVRYVAEVALLVPFVFILTSCGLIYEDNDCPPGTYLGFRITTDWRLAPEAEPEGMTFSFFREGEANPWMFDFPGRDGGPARLPEGCYGAVGYNNDAAGVVIVNDGSYSGVEATTLPSGLYPDAEDGGFWHGERVMHSPGRLWVAAVAPFRLSPSKAEWTDPFTGNTAALSPPEIIMTPQLATPRIRVEVRDVANLKSVSRVDSWISGLRSGCLLSDIRRPGDRATCPFSLGAASESSLRGSLYTFGLQDAESCLNILTLRFVMSDKTVREFSFDITSALRASPDPTDMLAIVSGVELPDTGSSGGFDVSVDGWTVIRIDITDGSSPG